MPDGMSFDKYIDNPTGSSIFTQRNLYKQLYKDKFDKILVREQGHIDWKVFKTDDIHDTWYIHMRIPSEVVPDFYYDVVLRFYTTENFKKSEANLRRYAVGFFSNDPAFCYTFAHAFKKNKLFIPDLESRMPRKFLAQRADVRNPKDDVFYVKSLFFAYLVMEKYNLFSKPMLNQHAVPYKQRDLLNLVAPADVKIIARQKAKAEIDAQARKEREAKRRPQTNLGIQTKQSKASPFSKTTKATRVVGNSRTTKKTHTITATKHGGSS